MSTSYDWTFVVRGRSMLDETDLLPAAHYGFTEKELQALPIKKHRRASEADLRLARVESKGALRFKSSH
jgi:hypothetical protein